MIYKGFWKISEGKSFIYIYFSFLCYIVIAQISAIFTVYLQFFL